MINEWHLLRSPPSDAADTAYICCIIFSSDKRADSSCRRGVLIPPYRHANIIAITGSAPRPSRIPASSTGAQRHGSAAYADATSAFAFSDDFTRGEAATAKYRHDVAAIA